MSKRRSSLRHGRAPKGLPFVPLSLMFSALLLAYGLSTRTLSILPEGYRAVSAAGDAPLAEAEPRAHGHAHPAQRDGRTERARRRRHERIHALHERVGERAGEARRRTGEGEVAERPTERKTTGVARPETLTSAVRAQGNGSAAEEGALFVGAGPPPTGGGARVGEEEKEEEEEKKKREKKKKEKERKAKKDGNKTQEFRGALGGTTDGMVRGQNVTRVSYTVYKIIKLFGFGSMADSPAGAHVEWMGEVVRRLAYDVPFFEYVAVDGSADGVERARETVGSVVDGEYYTADVESEMPRRVDVVVHWTELDGGGSDARSKAYVRHVARVMRAAKKAGCGYVVVGQFPRLNGPSPAFRKGRWRFVGTDEEEPFLFNEHVRGVVPMGKGGKAYMLYLTFYSLKSVPMEALDAVA